VDVAVDRRFGHGDGGEDLAIWTAFWSDDEASGVKVGVGMHAASAHARLSTARRRFAGLVWPMSFASSSSWAIHLSSFVAARGGEGQDVREGVMGATRLTRHRGPTLKLWLAGAARNANASLQRRKAEGRSQRFPQHQPYKRFFDIPLDPLSTNLGSKMASVTDCHDPPPPPAPHGQYAIERTLSQPPFSPKQELSNELHPTRPTRARVKTEAPADARPCSSISNGIQSDTRPRGTHGAKLAGAGVQMLPRTYLADRHGSPAFFVHVGTGRGGVFACTPSPIEQDIK
ncbi:hypothetical protein BDK51DRAFT_28023, partial [Blyttiomyces helicus]